MIPIRYCMYLYVYCTYYAPICRANGMEKASFARIVGAERRAADYIQKAVWKKWVFSLDLKGRRDLADLTSWGSLFQTASDALVKVRCPAVDLSPGDGKTTLRSRPEAPDARLVFRNEIGEVARLASLASLCYSSTFASIYLSVLNQSNAKIMNFFNYFI